MLHQHAVPRRVVSDNVDDYLHPTLMGPGDQLLKIFFTAVIRIDCVVITNCVWTADTPLLLFLSNRMNRHQPQNCHSKLFEIVESSGDSFEITLRREGSR